MRGFLRTHRHYILLSTTVLASSLLIASVPSAQAAETYYFRYPIALGWGTGSGGFPTPVPEDGGEGGHDDGDTEEELGEVCDGSLSGSSGTAAANEEITIDPASFEGFEACGEHVKMRILVYADGSL